MSFLTPIGRTTGRHPFRTALEAARKAKDATVNMTAPTAAAWIILIGVVGTLAIENLP